MSSSEQQPTSTRGPKRLPSQHAAVNARVFPWARTLFATLLAGALFVGTASSLIVANLDRQVKGAVLNTDHLGAVQDTKEEAPPDSFHGRSVNILIAGIDSRYGENDGIGSGTSETETSIRSDTTMVLHLSADRKSTTVMSIPRDLMTTIPSCVLSDGTVTYEQYGMFNSAFATGAVTDDLAAGIACTQATVEYLTGIDIDGFAVIDFAGFEKLIDALGGVEICLEEAIYDSGGYTGLDLPAGCQVLDGEAGLDYARARHVNISDGSDISRIDRQQKLVGAIIAQVLDSNMLTDLPKLYAFMQESLQIAAFSSSLDDLRTDAGLVNSIRNTKREDFRFVTVPWGSDINDPNRVVTEEPLATDLFMALADDEDLPVGLIYRDLDNHRFIIGEEGESIMIDDEGNHVILDENGEMIPSPAPTSDEEYSEEYSEGTDNG